MGVPWERTTSGGSGRARSASESASESRSTRSRSARGGSRGARSTTIDVNKRCSENYEGDTTYWCYGCRHTDRSIHSTKVKAADCEYPSINFTNRCISRSNGGSRPKAMLSDPLHWIKCMRQAVQRSDQGHASKRNLRRGSEFICIKKVYDIWVATGGMSNQQRHTKLTKAHFYPDGYANMVVSLSTQFFSNSTRQMIEDACNDNDLDSFKKEHYSFMIQIIGHINRLTDITNGRSLGAVGEGGNVRRYDAHFSPDTGRRTQEELLDVLAWFSDWKAEHDAEVKAGTADEYNFLPRQTWEDLNRLILGLVVTIEYYCIGEGFTLVPRRMNTDPCENEFAIHRQSGGSTGAINSTQADLADVNTQAVKSSSRVAKSNNYYAPPKSRSF